MSNKANTEAIRNMSGNHPGWLEKARNAHASKIAIKTLRDAGVGKRSARSSVHMALNFGKFGKRGEYGSPS